MSIEVLSLSMPMERAKFKRYKLKCGEGELYDNRQKRSWKVHFNQVHTQASRTIKANINDLTQSA